MEGHGAVEISACYERLFRKSSPLLFAYSEQNTLTRHCSEDKINSNRTPRQILNELEWLIKSKTNEVPCARDVLAAMSDEDADPKYRNYERHFGFQPIAVQPFEGESKEAFAKRAEQIYERNKNLHNRIFSIYQSYAKLLANKS